MSRRSKKILLWTGAALSVPLLLVLLLLWWAGSQGSLARTLQLAQRWLPADQHLAAIQVQGSLTGGGRIGLGSQPVGVGRELGFDLLPVGFAQGVTGTEQGRYDGRGKCTHRAGPGRVKTFVEC
jgi:hypothetical protein